MAAARSSWKRLHTDLEDGDECLPISKRICSLHIEAQTQGVSSQVGQEAHVSTLHGSCNGAGAGSSQFATGTSHQLYSDSDVLQPGDSCLLDSSGHHSPCVRAHSRGVHQDSLQSDTDTSHSLGGPQFGQSVSDPISSNLAPGHSLDPMFTTAETRNLLCMSGPQTNHNDGLVHSQHGLHASAIQNGHSPLASHFHSCSPPGCPDPSLLGVIPEGSQQFHLQQLPTGVYDPELGMEENPYYFSINQMLYEAHLCRVRRGSGFLNNS